MSELVDRLRKRAEIRRQIPGRKSVQEGKPDRIADLLDEAAARLTELETKVDLFSEYVEYGDLLENEELISHGST